jgi:phospholipase C
MKAAASALALALLGSAAAARAGDGAACPFDAGALPVETLPQGLPHGEEIPIDHVVVLMQENRSFDHYFGRLGHGAEGFPSDASNPDPLGGEPIRPFHQRMTCDVADVAHSWNASHQQWNGGAMDGFTATNVHPADPSARRAMSYYTKKELNYYFKLYRTFAIGDRYFCSLLGPTYPNRYYLLMATSAGLVRNLRPVDPQPKTIFEALDDAGASWKIYYSDVPFAILLGYANLHSENWHEVGDFLVDAAAGTLPNVSFVDPVFFADLNTQSDEHPPANVQTGQAFVAGVIGAVMASPLWERSAVFLTYDEHGGYYDHVPPPPACPPGDVPPQLEEGDVPGAFDRYGFRVPVVVVSPYARKRFVSHAVHDHASILRFIETRFDLPALTRRDANAGAMLEFFDFESPPFLKPPRLPAPKRSKKRAAECAALEAGGAP